MRYLQLTIKGLFGAHDMIEIGYDMNLDNDRKWYRHDKHLSYHMFVVHMISYISQLNGKITLIINFIF